MVNKYLYILKKKKKNKKLLGLAACEESQAVCKAFRKFGHEFYSCDLLPCSGGHPEWHIRGDVLKELKNYWDIIIAFPPCTYLTLLSAIVKDVSTDTSTQDPEG